jgi:hypothetical protein
MMSSDKMTIPIIAAQFGFGVVSPDWCGIDPVLPMLDRMRKDGAVVVIKLDGERTGSDDNGPYTVVVSGGALGSEFLRVDKQVLEDALSWVIVRYATRVWGYRASIAHG